MSILNLRNLFSTSQTPSNNLTTVNNPDNKQQGETYIQYGTRICGKVNASEAALQPCLQRIYLMEKQIQNKDQTLQNQLRSEHQQRIIKIEGDIEQQENCIKAIDERIITLTEQEKETRDKLTDARSRDGEENKMARIKMFIGLLILFFLSIYLFIFYSSTFYSAFFKQFSFDTGVAEAMFDQQALPNALNQGIGCLIFILCAPIIFLGLGYILHYYSIGKGYSKYFKMSAIVLITFVFDCILAYMIAKKIYEIEILTKLGDFPTFNINMAITDPNVWAVIFCGFITYMIWGFVFDLTITAYEELRSNRREIEHLESRIHQNDNDKLNLQQQKQNIQDKITALNTEKQMIKNRLSSTAFFYNETIIRTALTDFFTGWITMMSPMGRNTNEQDRAQNIFNDIINSLFSKP